MSIDIFDGLEKRVEELIAYVELYKSELDLAVAENQNLNAQLKVAMEQIQTLNQENQQLKEEQQIWNQRIQKIVGRVGEVTEA